MSGSSTRKRRLGQPSSTIHGVYEVPLTQGKIAFIDAEDFLEVSKWSWCYMTKQRGNHQRLNEYAHANTALPDGSRRYMEMHVYLLRPEKGFEVDHIDGDGLNNRRSNLRVCEHRQNMRNMRRKLTGRSRYKGVAWFKRDSCWRAYIVLDARQIHLGYFDDEIDAARAYDIAARNLFGEHAYLNCEMYPDFAALVVGRNEIRKRPRTHDWSTSINPQVILTENDRMFAFQMRAALERGKTTLFDEGADHSREEAV